MNKQIYYFIWHIIKFLFSNIKKIRFFKKVEMSEINLFNSLIAGEQSSKLEENIDMNKSKSNK